MTESEQTKTKTFVFVEPFWMAPQRAILMTFLNFSYEEELTVSIISFWFYYAVDRHHRA